MYEIDDHCGIATHWLFISLVPAVTILIEDRNQMACHGLSMLFISTADRRRRRTECD